jgi:16S rRNA (uracil1498-N3)-methyltransferase
LVSGPWPDGVIVVGPDQRRHVGTVLRREPGSPVSYTDGSGTVGEGVWSGAGIERGAERVEPEPTARLTLAVAPPDSKERQRWLVEKCTELGVARLRWLRTRFGQGRVPQHDKAHAWMVAALEQSRRSRIMSVDRDWSSIVDLGVFIAADLGGAPFQPEEVLTVAIGPEGGWAPDELPGSCRRVSLGKGVLRSETAAIAAAAVHAATMNQ